ncbi:MAG: uroporphyrinogen-III C-methyltransferase [Candidatus Competibacteraceae bacterium]
MTDQKSDSDNKTPTLDKPASVTPPVATSPQSGRGLAALALLVGLGAGGGSGYLWYLWQQDQATQASRLDAAIKQSLAQRDPEFQALKTQVQKFQEFQTGITQARTDNQALREQLLGLTGDLQPLKNAMELHKGETDVIKGEMKLLRESQDAHKDNTQQQKADLSQQLQEQLASIAALREQLQNLKLGQAGLTTELEAVRTIAAKGGDINAFPLAEVDYLLRLADAKLKLERNVPAARLALDVAQQRLTAVNETRLASVKTMLGEAIASLRGVQLPDIKALSHKIIAMEKPVGSLPLKLDSGISDIRERIKPATTVSLSAGADRSWWERGSEAVWNQFKDIVVIRRQRIETPPLIARENEFFLRQNLRLELEGMRLALLRGDAETYQTSYQSVYDWTQTYFDVADSKVTAFLAELQALQTIQLNPYIPDLTGLRQALQEFMTQRQPIRALRSAPALVPAQSTEPAVTEEAQ